MDVHSLNKYLLNGPVSGSFRHRGMPNEKMRLHCPLNFIAYLQTSKIYSLLDDRHCIEKAGKGIGRPGRGEGLSVREGGAGGVLSSEE